MGGSISLQNVLDYGQLTLNTGPGATAMSAIFASAMGELKAWFRRPVGVETFTETIRHAGYDDFLAFENTPVQSVEAISVEGVAYDVKFFDVASFGLDQLGPNFVMPGLWTTFEVRYTAGIDLSKNPGLSGLICRTVINEWYRSSPATMELTRGGAVDRFATDGGYQVQFSKNVAVSGVSGGAAGQVGLFAPGALLPYESLRRKT